MKILIDMSNSPHVLFFKPIIERLEEKGHKIKIIAREHAQTIGLLDLYGLEYNVVGKHAGKNILKKIINAISRIIKIRKYISKEKPDICISHQSPYIIYAAFLEKVKRIYIFDNNHAKLQNNLTFPLSTKIICPKAININNINSKKFVKYPGIKEAIYLRNLKTNNKGLEKINKIKKKKILIRTEISSAAYLKGNPLFNLIKELSRQNYQIIVSTRTKQEVLKYKGLNNVIVLDKPVDGPSLIKQVDLVMSGGGTMNREAAVLGIPVISLYSGELLDVDKYLIKKGLMIHNKNPSLDLIKKIMKNKTKKINFNNIGKEAINQIINEIEDLK